MIDSMFIPKTPRGQRSKRKPNVTVSSPLAAAIVRKARFFDSKFIGEEIRSLKPACRAHVITRNHTTNAVSTKSGSVTTYKTCKEANQ